MLVVRTVVSVDFENEKEFLEQIFEQYEKKPVVVQGDKPLTIGGQSLNPSLYLVYRILKTQYPEKDWAEQIKALIYEFELIEETHALNKKHEVCEQVSKYLDAMKVEHSLEHTIDGVQIPIYLTQQKTLVTLFPKSFINFDNFTFTGTGALTTRFYKGLLKEDENFTFVSLSDFFRQQDNMSKVNYLIGQGIENDNVSGEFDFTGLGLSDDDKDTSGSDKSGSDSESDSDSSSDDEREVANVDSVEQEADTLVEDFEDLELSEESSEENGLKDDMDLKEEEGKAEGIGMEEVKLSDDSVESK